MNKAVTAPLPASVLEALARYDTPTICNAMEIVAPERRLIGYPWHILSFGSVLYLLSLPWGWKSYRNHERNAAAAAQQVPAADAAAAPSTVAPAFAPAPSSPAPSDTEDERPTRLN